MAGPAEDVHRQSRGVGELEEEDLLTRNLCDAGQIRAAGEDVEAVEASADARMIGSLDQVPST
jgi:hypothetical protein